MTRECRWHNSHEKLEYLDPLFTISWKLGVLLKQSPYLQYAKRYILVQMTFMVGKKGKNMAKKKTEAINYKEALSIQASLNDKKLGEVVERYNDFIERYEQFENNTAFSNLTFAEASLCAFDYAVNLDKENETGGSIKTYLENGLKSLAGVKSQASLVFGLGKYVTSWKKVLSSCLTLLMKTEMKLENISVLLSMVQTT